MIPQIDSYFANYYQCISNMKTQIYTRQKTILIKSGSGWLRAHTMYMYRYVYQQMPMAVVASHLEHLEACIILILIMDSEYINCTMSCTDF